MTTSKGKHWKDRLRQERILRNWRQSDLAERLGTSVSSVKRWERGSHLPGAYFRVKLCMLFGKSAEELGLVEIAPPSQANAEDVLEPLSDSQEGRALWTVPYQRNPHFTGRDDLLKQLEQHLSPHEKPGLTSPRLAALTQPLAVKGLGGIGKTQVAVEYAYRAREQGRYRHTLWIDAASEEAIMACFVPLAELLPAFAAKEEKDQPKLVAAMKRWLEECQQPWFLIFDNADDLSMIPQYLPHQGNGYILLTTRANAVGFLATSLEVEQMGLMEGTQLLLHRAQRLRATDEQRNEATTVVSALDGFPLALDQAGAYIEETRCSFGDYLQLYREQRKALLARRGRQATNYPDSVATTWSLSFQKIEQQSPAAAELLRLCAFLAPDHIPEKLLKEGAAHWPPVLQRAAGDLFAFNQILEALLAFSLVKRLAEDHSLAIHRLVQAVVQENLSQQAQQAWIQRVILVLDQVFPRESQSMQCWPWCEQLMPHVLNMLIPPEHAPAPDLLNTSSLLQKTATYFRHRARYPEAERYHQQALGMREQVLGSEHEGLVEPLIGLIEAIWIRTHDLAMIMLAQRAITILERTQGTRSFALIKPLNILAEAYCVQGQVVEAEHLLLRSLSIWITTIHQESAGLEPSSNDIPHQEKEKPTGEALIQQALALWEQTPQRDHDPVGQALCALGHVYQQQQRSAQAKALLLSLHRLGKRDLGENHYVLTWPLMILAEVDVGQGKLEEAEHCYQQILAIREEALGPQHPLTREARAGYAAFIQLMEREEEASPVHSRMGLRS